MESLRDPYVFQVFQRDLILINKAASASLRFGKSAKYYPDSAIAQVFNVHPSCIRINDGVMSYTVMSILW